MTLLGCEHCGFTFRPRAAFLTMEHCPRCLATRRVAEPLRVIEGPPAPSVALSDAPAGATRRAPAARLG